MRHRRRTLEVEKFISMVSSPYNIGSMGEKTIARLNLALQGIARLYAMKDGFDSRIDCKLVILLSLYYRNLQAPGAKRHSHSAELILLRIRIIND